MPGPVNIFGRPIFIQDVTSDDVQQATQVATTGYEFTAGFSDRLIGAPNSQTGSDVLYTQQMSDDDIWLRFGLDSARQVANDVPYWTDPTPASPAGVGLYGGTALPGGITKLFNFTEDSAFNQAVTAGDLKYTAATGSCDWSEVLIGDHAEVRFDFNITPQIANTTVEVGLVFASRSSGGAITLTSVLTAQPVFFGSGTVGRRYMNRVPINVSFASNEDIRAFALPAVRADNPVIVQPLGMLSTLRR